MFDEKLLKQLHKIGTEITYQRSEHIIYKGHIPKMGFILLEGRMELELTRSKKKIPLLSVIGIKELIENTPYKHSVKVFPKTKVLAIDKSSLKLVSNYKLTQSFIDSLLEVKAS